MRSNTVLTPPFNMAIYFDYSVEDYSNIGGAGLTVNAADDIFVAFTPSDSSPITIFKANLNTDTLSQKFLY